MNELYTNGIKLNHKFIMCIHGDGGRSWLRAASVRGLKFRAHKVQAR
jgi:hypothetical protein